MVQIQEEKKKKNQPNHLLSLCTSADMKACDTESNRKALWQIGQNAEWVSLALTMLDYLDVSLF